PPTCAVMCPPLTTKNWSSYKPLIAIGTNQGSIQVFNLSTGILTREYSIHTGSVRGVSWSSLSSFFSWSLTPGSSSKNELQLLDLKTGHSTHISLGKHAEEVPIECVKVSQLRQYFFIAFKDRPLQLWDLKNLCVLKELPRNFPNITALEWSPSHHSKHLKKKLSSQLEASGASDIASHVLDPKRLDPTQTQIWIKEHFVCVDVNGLLYHFLVEGNNVKDGSKVQCDSTLGVVQCMAWKGDIMVLADNEGNLSIWELKARVTRLVATHRGCIKKIKFAPGRGNLKLGVLFTDGMDVWDLQSAEMYSSYKIPKDSSPTVDLDWLASDLPLIVQASGCLQVMDMELQSSTVAMASLSLHDSIWCPHILESKTALILKTILQHHLGREPCSLTDISDLELQPELEKILLDQLCLVPKVISDYVPKTPMGTAEKCLLTAHLFDDEAESVFWDVALHYLRREKARLSCPLHKTNHKPPQATSRPRSSSDLFNPSDATAKIKRSFSSNSLDLLTIDDDLQITAVEAPGTSDYCCCLPVSLDMCFEILCDSDAFQKAQLDRIALHDSKRSTYEHTRKCAEALVLLGQADRAVQLFLETESSNDNYYVDSL
ncbi:WD repeat-containing protein 11, partial [Exaiptasia diaphana]